MNIFRKKQRLMAEIADTQKMLELVIDHPLMYEGFSERFNFLTRELESLPKETLEPSIQLLFSGNAISGSAGIKASFLSKTLTPFQEMVKTQFALVRFGKVGKRGKTKKTTNTELFLTALPTGSFGVELTQLQFSDLFDSMDVSMAIKRVMHVVFEATKSDESFELIVENNPKRNLTNLKKFLKEVADESSMLKMESNELGIEISKEKISEAFGRVAATSDEESDLFVNGTFRGLLLESGRFEILNEEGRTLSGFVSEDLNEETLIEFDKKFLNTVCEIHLRVHKTHFKTGNVKTDYELLEIK